LVSPVLS
jgi:cyclophilin family peptidyl-prolyl cis-trans isomerase